MSELVKIIKMINASLDLLYSQDEYLIWNQNGRCNNHVSERGIVFRYGIYFDEIARVEFPRLNVDTEYNRDQGDVKRLPIRQNGSFPDLILHERGTNKNNLVVMEFKPWWCVNQDEDKRKIEALCDNKERYNYKYGAMILLGKKRDEVEIDIYYENRWVLLNDIIQKEIFL